MKAALIYTYIAKGGGVSIQNKAVFYKQEVTLKVRLNDKVVGLMKLDKTQRSIVLLYAVLKVISYRMWIFLC